MIERSILALLLVGLLIGVIAVVKPFTTAILFGAALATAVWPVRQALVRRGLGRGLAAALLLLLSLVLVVLPLLAFAPHLADQLVSGAQRVQSYFAATPDQPTWIKAVPLLGSRLGAAWDVAAGAIRGVAYGVIGTAAIQAILLAIGLAVAGVPGAGTLGFVGLLLAISQIGGPLLILIWGGAAGGTSRRISRSGARL